MNFQKSAMLFTSLKQSPIAMWLVVWPNSLSHRASLLVLLQYKHTHLNILAAWNRSSHVRLTITAVHMALHIYYSSLTQQQSYTISWGQLFNQKKFIGRYSQVKSIMPK